MKKINLPLIIVLLIAFLFRLALFLTEDGVLWPDSVTYLKWAREIAENFNYSSHPSYRTPVYPSFLAFFIWISPKIYLGKLILATQYLLGLFATFFFYQTLVQVFSIRVSLLAALLFSINPLELYYETVIQTEALFIPIFSLVLFLSFKFMDKGSFRLAVLLGVSLGILSLTRPLAQMLLLLVLSLTFLAHYKNKKIIKLIFLAALTYGLTIFPWLSINHNHYGYWGISKDFGLNLFHRTFDLDQLTIESSENDSFHQLAMKEKDKNRKTYFYILSKLRQKEMSYNEIDSVMAEYGRELIAGNLPQYLLGSINVFWEYFFLPHNSVQFCDVGNSTYLCSFSEQRLFSDLFPQRPIVDNFKKLRLIIFYYFNLWRYFDIFLSALSLLGIFVVIKSEKSHKLKFCLLIGIVLYFALIVSLFSSAEDRYRLPIIPLLLPFAIYFLDNLKLWKYKRP